jgi:hypothetical protein
MPIISALRRLKQEDLQFEATLGYVVRPCPKKKSKSHCTHTQFHVYVCMYMTQLKKKRIGFQELGELAEVLGRWLTQTGNKLCVPPSYITPCISSPGPSCIFSFYNTFIIL